MDPEALEAFIAVATREEIAEQLRDLWQVIRCGVAMVSAMDLPTVPAVSLASG